MSTPASIKIDKIQPVFEIFSFQIPIFLIYELFASSKIIYPPPIQNTIHLQKHSILLNAISSSFSICYYLYNQERDINEKSVYIVI